MKRNIACWMLTVAFFVLAVFSLGGCGGSSDNSSSSNEALRSAIFVGTTGGSLYSALESKLGFASKLSDDAGAEVVGSLGEGDIAVFCAGYFSSMNSTKTGLLSALYNSSITITVNRKHTITINSYPIHNFTDGSDWYIIKLGGTLNPSGQYNREDRTGNSDIVWGHTGYYTFGVSLYTLDRGYHSLQWLMHNSEKAKYTSGITSMDSSPKNVNRTAQKNSRPDSESKRQTRYLREDGPKC